MKATPKYGFLVVLVLLLGSSCATYKAQYKDQLQQSSLPDLEISHSFYLIGDAGASELGKKSMALTALERELKSAPDNSTVLFLGDNIYQRGLVAEDHPNYQLAKHQLDAQTSVVKNFKGRSIFIPGNHDWYSGLDGLKRQERYVENILGKDSFLPENGCPLEKVEIGEDIVLLIVDSEWYITKWDKHPQINDECEFRTRARFFEEFESEIKKARGKTTIVAIHHPMFTNGPHGGQYSFGSHMSPLPGLGTLKNMLLKMGGASPADLQHHRYDELKSRIVTLSQENDKVVFVSGHEHSLQYLIEENLHQIVSGSGSKTTATRNVYGGQFSYGSPGFARLDVYTNGSSYLRFYSALDEKVVYESPVLEEDEKVAQTFDDNFPSTVRASIYTSSETEKSKFYKWLWGERYRDLFSREIEVAVVNLDTIHGGLKPVRKGGGHQSVSLRLENSKGQEYIMRALRKDAELYIQSVAFKEQYIRGEFEGTKTASLVGDVFTGSHPYTPFIIGDLSEAVGVFHLNPKIYYIPKQNALGRFNNEFGNTLYMLEERAGDNHGDKASFGFANELISTYDLFNELREDEENQLDEAAYVRARVFDMLIGDWDRHQDQWRWAEFKKDGKTIYKPMPRDRDQAFSIMNDGFMLGTATALAQPTRLLNAYDVDIKDIRYSNFNPYIVDVALIQESGRDTWLEQAEYVATNITDEVIDKAFAGLPPEVQDASMEEIKRKLKGRRTNLKKIVEAYYKVLNKHSVITGTDKDDWFDIERMPDGETKITVYRIKDDKKADLIHERTYHRDDTKEIWVYGLDDDDYFHVSGTGDRMIKIRLVGGMNNDSYEVKNGSKIHIYDFRTKPNTFVTQKGQKHLRNDYETNIYDYKKPAYNSNILLPLIGFNPDDGLRIGIMDTYTVNGFERNEFTASHRIGASVYTATGGFDLGYAGEFANVVGQWNLAVRAKFTSPNFAINFFGFGNSTLNLESEDSDNFNLDYNRVKIGTFGGYAGLVWKGENGGRFDVGIDYETFEVEETETRFIEDYIAAFPFDTDSKFLSSKARYTYKRFDTPAFPTLGLLFSLEGGYTFNLENSNAFTYMVPELSFYHKVVPSGRLVFRTTSKAHLNFGDDFEFYQAANIGGNDGLRGYRNQRFAGKNSFYQSSDLLFNFRRVKTSILPVEVGLFGGFDVGRVWIDNNRVLDPSFNGGGWNTSVGGGFFVNASDLLSANLGLFNSDDGPRFYLGFRLGL